MTTRLICKNCNGVRFEVTRRFIRTGLYSVHPEYIYTCVECGSCKTDWIIEDEEP